MCPMLQMSFMSKSCYRKVNKLSRTKWKCFAEKRLFWHICSCMAAHEHEASACMCRLLVSRRVARHTIAAGLVMDINKKRLSLPFQHLSRFFVPRLGLEPRWITPLVFETSASTYSAIWAFWKGDAKVQVIFDINKFLALFFSKCLRLPSSRLPSGNNYKYVKMKN